MFHMKEVSKGLCRCSLLLLTVPAVILAQSYDISWHTIDGGGGTSTGGGYELSGTIGQPDASAADALTGGGYTLTGGFWPGAVPACGTFVAADFDRDCDVDAADFARFVVCDTGPSVPYNPAALPAGCTFAPDAQNQIAPDLDKDNDVDQDDFSILQRCTTGPGVPSDPNCAG